MATGKLIVLVLLLGFLALELKIEEREKEKLLEDMSKHIILLQNEIDTIQEKAKAETTKAYARVNELERQVEKLEEFLREQKKSQPSLELQGSKAESQEKVFSSENKEQESPALKKQWQQAMDSLAPHMETLKTKANEGYEVSRDTIKPHLVRAQESLSPHVQIVKEFGDQVVAASRPHIEKVIAASQPHIEILTDIVQPYTKPVRHAYGRFLITATKYHHRIQAAFRTRETRHNPLPQDEMHA